MEGISRLARLMREISASAAARAAQPPRAPAAAALPGFGLLPEQAREAVAILEWLVEEIPLLPEPQRAEALRRAPLPCLLHAPLCMPCFAGTLSVVVLRSPLRMLSSAGVHVAALVVAGQCGAAPSPALSATLLAA